MLRRWLQPLLSGRIITAVSIGPLVYLFGLLLGLPPTSGELLRLSLGIVMLLHAGHIMNDMFDLRTDAITIPDRLEGITQRLRNKNLQTLYYSVSLAAGILLVYSTGSPAALAWAILMKLIGALYCCHMYKDILIWKNVVCYIIVMGWAATPIFIVGADALPDRTLHEFLCILGLAFFVTMPTDIMGDIRDIEGDKLERVTIPIKWGIPVAMRICFVAQVTCIAILFINPFARGHYLYWTFLSLGSVISLWPYAMKSSYKVHEKMLKYSAGFFLLGLIADKLM